MADGSTAGHQHATPEGAAVVAASLDHIVILVSDPQRSLPFYRSLLPLIGFTATTASVFGNKGGVQLDIREASDTRHPYRRQAPGLNHLGFTAGNRAQVEAVRDAMASAGYEVPEIQEYPDGCALFVKDPDGMRIELSTYGER